MQLPRNSVTHNQEHTNKMVREADDSFVGNRLQKNIQLHGGRQLGLKKKKKKTAENDTAERLGYQHLVLISGGICFIYKHFRVVKLV